ncbi:MAG: phosphate ABC transporter permease subunit PstC [Spirochaetaceae bacterium]|jgi:phosphate transport system permease protein|nr:phosphate ABC transporter permease subunit PstC [Spirochaetaceae bacterium]
MKTRNTVGSEKAAINKTKAHGGLKKPLMEPFMRTVFLAAASLSILCVALICGFLFANGIPAIGQIGPLKFFAGTAWRPGNGLYGIAPMILGSLYVTAGAIVAGVPLGLLCAVFMARFCPARLHAVMSPAVTLLAGIPSVVYGFFGLVVLVPALRSLGAGNGKSILTASLLLGMMILPTIISVSEAALRAVPESYYEGALALGASHEEAVFFVLTPAAGSGLMAAVILGVGRSIGETMAVIMVAGNQAIIPQSLFRGARTLTANIVLEMGYAADLHREALIATAATLFVFILIINLLFTLAKGRMPR